VDFPAGEGKMIWMARAAAGVFVALAAPAAFAQTFAWERPVIGAVRPNGENQCFARARVPAEVEEFAVQRVASPARTAVRTVPAVYETVRVERVLQPERTEYIIIPGEYRTVTSPVPVSTGRSETIVHPPQYQTLTQRVLIRPEYVTWRAGCATYGRSMELAGAPDETLCRQQVPAQYKSFTRKRLVSPARTETRWIPERIEYVTRQENIKPAQVVTRVVPARTAYVNERRLVMPERIETYMIPAEIVTEKKTRIVNPERFEWREVLCDGGRESAKIRRVQTALRSKGYKIGVDGVFGPQTLNAIELFQRERKLATGYLTVETMNALGVN
jgi:hypothetical protein